MTALRGMLTLVELAAEVSADEIDTVIIAFSDHYGRLLGKRLDAEYFLAEAAQHGSHACNYLLTTDMEMEPVPGYRFANWERGYGDFQLAPDLSTLRRASWLAKTAIVLCDVEDEAAEQPVAVAPRSILRRQLEATAALGYSAMAASELEYYIYRDSYREANEKGYAELEPMGWYLEDYHILQGSREESFTAPARRHLKGSGIPVESSKGEWGLGQHELNIRYADALTMADRHSIMKHCLKEIARRAGPQRHIHGEALQRAGRLKLSYPPQSNAGGARMPSPASGSAWAGFGVGCISSFPGWLDGASAGVDGLLCADDQLLQALRRRILGADAHRLELRQSHGPAFASLAPARACALNAARRAPIATRIWLMRRRWHRGLMASPRRLSRRTYSKAISMRRVICRGCPIPWRGRSTSLRAAHSRAPPLAPKSSSITRISSARRSRASARAVTDWERKRYFERI